MPMSKKANTAAKKRQGARRLAGVGRAAGERCREEAPSKKKR